jgi:acyl dehydratase
MSEGEATAGATATVIPFAALESAVGRTFGPSDPIHIGQDKIDQFAATTGDRQWVHVDVERAAATGGTLAHGYMTLSLIPLVVSQLLHISGVDHALNYGSNKIRYPAPLRSGSDVRGTLRIVSVEQRGEGLLMEIEGSIQADGADRPACVARTLTLLYPGDGLHGAFEQNKS